MIKSNVSKVRDIWCALLTTGSLLIFSGSLSADPAPQGSCWDILVGPSGPFGASGAGASDANSSLRNGVPIIVTSGPGTAYREDVIIKDPNGQVNPPIIRLNFSHTQNPEQFAGVNGVVKKVSEGPVALMADNGGPKIRVTHPQGQFQARQGMELVISPFPDNTTETANLKYLTMTELEFGWITKHLRIGNEVIIGDDIQAVVTNVDPGRSFKIIIKTLPQDNYLITGRKGIQAPGVDVDAPALTPLDLMNTDWEVWSGAFHGVTISFIRDGNDVRELSDYMATIINLIFPAIKKAESLSELKQDSSVDLGRINGFLAAVSFRAGFDHLNEDERYRQIRKGVLNHPGVAPMIMAKIETQTALRNLESIVTELHKVNGGIIAARGDLLIQTQRDLPRAVLLIVKMAQRVGIPVFVATGGFSTPSERSVLTPSDTVDPAQTSALGSGIMVSDPTAMAKSEEVLRQTIGAIEMVAGKGHNQAQTLRLGVELVGPELKARFKALPQPELISQAKALVALAKKSDKKSDKESGKKSTERVLGRTPLVFTWMPSQKLIQAIRAVDWFVPILILIDTAKVNPELTFRAKRMQYNGFLRVEHYSSSSHRDWSAKVQEVNWGQPGDRVVLVGSDGRGSAEILKTWGAWEEPVQ